MCQGVKVSANSFRIMRGGEEGMREKREREGEGGSHRQMQGQN